LKLILKNILAILTQKEKRDLGLFTVLNIIISILDIAFLAFLLFVVGFYTGAPFPNRFIFLANFFKPYPLVLITAFFLLFSLKNFIGFLIFKAQYDYAFAVASRISKKNLLNYLEGNYSDYVNTDSSVNIRKISQQPIEFCQYVLTGLQQIVTQIALILFTVIAILLFNATLFLLLFLILLPAVFLIIYITKRKLGSVRMHVKTTGQKAIQYLQEALSGFIESNLYDKNYFFTNRYYVYQKKLNGYLSDQQIIQGMPARFIEIFAVFGLFILVVIIIHAGNSNTIPVITLGAFIAAAYKIIPGIAKILNCAGQIRTYEFVVNDLVSDTTSRSISTSDINKISSVEISNVSFKYDSHTILDNFSLRINSGDFIGIHGISGTGKTTVINLLLGFVSPEKGSISINNIVTETSNLRSYWKNIAYVKQQSFLIYDSVLKNIVLDENYDKQKLEYAINATGLNIFLASSEEGLEKTITENGKNISGGQRQRIALARALYKDADLIILDEPFNELDEDSETSILKKLKTMTNKGKTVILITHNKPSLTFCKQIVSLNAQE
jgi:ABC-type multidrug transport system fused ATPase/permease subunit